MKDLAELKKAIAELKTKRGEALKKSANPKADAALRALSKELKRGQRKLRKLEKPAKRAAQKEEKKEAPAQPKAAPAEEKKEPPKQEKAENK